MKMYWKNLIDYYTKKMADIAEGAEPESLEGAKKDAYEVIKTRYDTFKTQFPVLKDFIKTQVVKRFDDCVFYIGESADLDSLIVVGRYADGEVSPTLFLLKVGLEEVRQ